MTKKSKIQIPKEKGFVSRLIVTTVTQKTIDWLVNPEGGVKPVTTRHFLGDINIEINGVNITGMKAEPSEDPDKIPYTPNDILLFQTVVKAKDEREAGNIGIKRIVDAVNTLSFCGNIGLEIQENDWVFINPVNYGEDIRIEFQPRKTIISGNRRTGTIYRIQELLCEPPEGYNAIVSYSLDTDLGTPDSPYEIKLVTHKKFNESIAKIMPEINKHIIKNDKKLAIALKMYRKSMAASDIISGFLEIWLALELLGTSEEKSKAFTEEEKKAFKSIIENSSRDKNDKNRLYSYICNAHAKGKLQLMCENLKLPETSIITLDDLRTVRGNIIHPKKKVSADEKIVEAYTKGIRLLRESIQNRIEYLEKQPKEEKEL